MPIACASPLRRAAGIALAGALCSIGACAGDASRPPQSAPAESVRLMDAIRAEIGDAACETDAQCHSIGVGEKPCGGPEGYLAWSDLRTNPQRLLALVQQQRAARRAENERSGLRSDCRVVPDPGAGCRPRDRDGRKVCQPGAGGQGAAAGTV